MNRRLALATALLAGCATQAVPVSEATVTKSVLNSELTKKVSGYGALVFKRDSGWNNGACSFRLYVNGGPFADLGMSEMVTIYLPPGEHIVGARANGICFAGDAEMTVAVKPDQMRSYRVSVDAGGALKLQPTAF